MTIPAQVPMVLYTADGVTTVWNYNFLIPLQDDGITPAIGVYTNALGVVTELNSTEYVLTGVGNEGGGTVTISPAVASGTFILIRQELAYAQGTAVPNNSFYPNTVEMTADTLTEQIQRIAALLQSCVAVDASAGVLTPITAPPAERANMLIGFDGNGNLMLIPQ